MCDIASLGLRLLLMSFLHFGYSPFVPSTCLSSDSRMGHLRGLVSHARPPALMRSVSLTADYEPREKRCGEER